MKSSFIFILSLCLALSLKSQTISISGNVKDLGTNSPLENAKVQIKNLSNGFIDSVFSDAIGNW